MMTRKPKALESSMMQRPGRLALLFIGDSMKRLFIFSLLVSVSLFISMPAKAVDGLKLPPYKKVKLKNGMSVLLMEQHEVPIISFNFIVRAGSVADPQGKEGLASLTAGSLRKG